MPKRWVAPDQYPSLDPWTQCRTTHRRPSADWTRARRKTNINVKNCDTCMFTYFLRFSRYCCFLFKGLLVSKLCFLSFSMQNHAESSKHLIKKSVLDHIFFRHHFFLKNHRFWSPDNIFWWKNSVLQVSGRSTLENAYNITSTSKFSTQNLQIPYHLHPALSNSLDNREILLNMFWGFSCTHIFWDFVEHVLRFCWTCFDGATALGL